MRSTFNPSTGVGEFQTPLKLKNGTLVPKPPKAPSLVLNMTPTKSITYKHHYGSGSPNGNQIKLTICPSPKA
jgi:hypothetical protein